MTTDDRDSAAQLRELESLLRVDGEIAPSKREFAALLLDLSRRKRVIGGRKKPLRALGEIAHVAPQRLEQLVTSDVKPDYVTLDKLIALGGPSPSAWMRAIGYGDNEDSDDRQRDLRPALQAVENLIGAWPDEALYNLADHLATVMGLARSDNSPEQLPTAANRS